VDAVVSAIALQTLARDDRGRIAAQRIHACFCQAEQEDAVIAEWLPWFVRSSTEIRPGAGLLLAQQKQAWRPAIGE
jgi:hypothetical protein